MTTQCIKSYLAENEMEFEISFSVVRCATLYGCYLDRLSVFILQSDMAEKPLWDFWKSGAVQSNSSNTAYLKKVVRSKMVTLTSERITSHTKRAQAILSPSE